MTHFSKKTLAIAITSLLAGNAYAATPFILKDAHMVAGVPTTVTCKTGLTYASEINVDDSTNKFKSTASAASKADDPLDMLVDLGFGVAKSQNYFVRIDLNNAKFLVDPIVHVIHNSASQSEGYGTYDTTVPTLDDVGTKAEGGNGNSYYISSAKASATTDRTVGDNVTVALSDNTVIDALQITNKSGVGVKYRLYETAAAASQQNSASQLGAAVECPSYISFAQAIKFEVKPDGDPLKIDVGSASKKFANATGANVTDTVRLGSIKLDLATPTPLKAAGTAIALADIIDDTAGKSKYVLEGDFTAAKTSPGSVYLGTGNGVDDLATCGTSHKTFTVDSTGKSASLDITGLTGANYYAVCMKVDGATEIVSADYSISLNPVNQTGYTASSEKKALASLNRNGTVMQSPFFTIVAGYVPRFYLTNTGANPANFTVTLISDADATAPLVPGTVTSGTIPAKGSLMVWGKDITASGQRGAAIFQIDGPGENINGVFNFRNSTSGDFDSYVMVKK